MAAVAAPIDNQVRAPNSVAVLNLSFKTTDEDLRRTFAAAGTVVSADVVHRGTRSMGYGFVQFSSAAEVQSAIAKFNDAELDGRTVSVQVAKPRVARPPQQAGGAQQQQQQGGHAAAGAAGAGAAAGAAGAPARRVRTRRPRADGDVNSPVGSPAAAAATGVNGSPVGGEDGTARRTRRRRTRKPAGGVAADGSAAPAAGGAAAAPRAPREAKPKTASTTTLYVNNLPFTMDNAGLLALFAGSGAKSATVQVKANGKSKGVGFVEFNNTEEQQKALNNLKLTAQERELRLSVAWNEDIVRSQQQAAAAAANAAAAPPAAAAAAVQKTA